MQLATQAGGQIMKLLAENVSPRDIITENRHL